MYVVAGSQMTWRNVWPLENGGLKIGRPSRIGPCAATNKFGEWACGERLKVLCPARLPAWLTAVGGSSASIHEEPMSVSEGCRHIVQASRSDRSGGVGDQASHGRGPDHRGVIVSGPVGMPDHPMEGLPFQQDQLCPIGRRSRWSRTTSIDESLRRFNCWK